MKINELKQTQLDEGPIDFAKKVGAGISGLAQGGLAGGKAGWQAQGAANAQADMIKDVTSKALKNWATISQSKTMAGQEITADDVTNWFKQFSGKDAVNPVAGLQPAQVQQWIQKEVANYITQKAMGTPDFPPDLTGYTKEELTQLKQQLEQSLQAA